jgi:hypothetical protein
VFGNRFKTPTDLDAGLYTYSTKRLYQISMLITTVLASILPIAGVVVLYFVTNTLARLGIIAGFTAAFSLVLSLSTTAKKTEVWMATSAYVTFQAVILDELIIMSKMNIKTNYCNIDSFAAVLVVFIGGSPT